MNDQPQITPAQITRWLDETGRSREWLSDQTGASTGTVSGWLAKGKPRPIPQPTLRLIERLMCDDLLGEPQFTLGEAKMIRQAMDQEGYDSLRKFMKDAVLANAQRLTASDGNVLRFELPFVGAVAAGEPVEAPRTDDYLPVSREFPPGHFIVEVNGRSAEPDFPDGSRWVIDGRDCFTPKHGKPCIVSDGNGSYLKKWNRKEKKFESIHPDFDDVIPGDEAKLQGYPVEMVG